MQTRIQLCICENGSNFEQLLLFLKEGTVTKALLVSSNNIYFKIVSLLKNIINMYLKKKNCLCIVLKEILIVILIMHVKANHMRRYRFENQLKLKIIIFSDPDDVNVFAG